MTSRYAALCVALALVVAGCGSGPPESRSTPTTSPRTSSTPSPSAPAGSGEWPFMMTACAEADGEPLLLVALGTSETAGWGIPGLDWSPQEAYPARHAGILCEQLGRPVELHSYFPSQGSNVLAKIAWWRDTLREDRQLRGDLAAAGVVDLWALDSHDVVDATFFRGCSGDWPRPLRGCLKRALADVPAQMDQVFGMIETTVRPGTPVLAADAFIPPEVLEASGDAPYWTEFNALVDPRFRVAAAAEDHGFVFVDTELTLNGPTRHEMLGPDLIQDDGLHLTADGQQVVAEAFAAADGLG